jgi:hypothetical protein
VGRSWYAIAFFLAGLGNPDHGPILHLEGPGFAGTEGPKVLPYVLRNRSIRPDSTKALNFSRK